MSDRLSKIKFLLSKVNDEKSNALELLDSEFEKVLKYGTPAESEAALELVQTFLCESLSKDHLDSSKVAA